MNSLKTMALVAVMAAVAYGVYASLHKKPDAEPPPGVADINPMAPTVQMSGSGTSTSPIEATSTPQFVEGGPVGAVPTLPPGVTQPTTAASGADILTSGHQSPLSVTAGPLNSSPVTALSPPAANYPTTGSSPTSFPSYGATPNPSATGAASPTAAATGRYPTTGFPDIKLPTGPVPTAHGEGYALAGDADANVRHGIPAQTISYDPLAGDVHQQFAKALQSARDQANAGRLIEAHLELSKWYDQPQLSTTETRQLIELLDRLAGTVIYSHKHHLLEAAYEIKPGDSLESISGQYQMPHTLLAKINGLNSAAPLQPGQKLKVLRGPFNAVVDLKNNRLTLFLQGRYAGRFPIGIGRDCIASPGDYEVKSITENPSYPATDRLAGAESANPFGRYWIDLGNQVGIHGTSDQRSVGRNDGPGCICLKEDDLEHIHDILAVGSKVLIRR